MTRKLHNCPLTKSIYDFDSKRVYFWGGIFSQWFESEFRDQGLTFNTAEQAMMYQKAMTFGDRETARLIMGPETAEGARTPRRRLPGLGLGRSPSGHRHAYQLPQVHVQWPTEELYADARWLGIR